MFTVVTLVLESLGTSSTPTDPSGPVSRTTVLSTFHTESDRLYTGCDTGRRAPPPLPRLPIVSPGPSLSFLFPTPSFPSRRPRQWRFSSGSTPLVNLYLYNIPVTNILPLITPSSPSGRRRECFKDTLSVRCQVYRVPRVSVPPTF